MKFIDPTGQGHTTLILTDAESRIIRKLLIELHDQTSDGYGIDAFNRGIARATERMQAEAKADRKANK